MRLIFPQPRNKLHSRFWFPQILNRHDGFHARTAHDINGTEGVQVQRDSREARRSRAFSGRGLCLKDQPQRAEISDCRFEGSLRSDCFILHSAWPLESQPLPIQLQVLRSHSSSRGKTVTLTNPPKVRTFASVAKRATTTRSNVFPILGSFCARRLPRTYAQLRRAANCLALLAARSRLLSPSP